MKIACLSGKGGAGKTLLAVNLAVTAGKSTYIDCDVEEPNGRLFLKPEGVQETEVSTLLPSFDADKCTSCKECVRFCRFHALVGVKGTPMLFPEVCHSCGGCRLVCPENAITEVPKTIGHLETGTRGDVKVVTGVLDPGEATGMPIIRKALDQAEGLTIIDGPPGSACSAMECVTQADYSLLVAEPTAFGFHNFRMVHELATLLGKPCGVVINKQEEPYGPLERFCEEQKIPVLARIPYDPRIAALSAGGQLVAETDGDFRSMMEGLLETIGGEIR